MLTETQYWAAMKTPSELALPNLNKLVTACLTNNFLSPQNIVSARKLSQLSGGNYNSMANLLDRPGFVRVEGEATGWYWLRDFGVTYPTAFPAMLQIPRKMITTNEKTILGNIEADRAVRQQIRPQDLISENERIITLLPNANKGEQTRAGLLKLVESMVDSMIQLESPPNRYAAAMYQLSENLHNGTLKII